MYRRSFNRNKSRRFGGRFNSFKKNINSQKIDSRAYVRASAPYKEDVYTPKFNFSDFPINPKVLENLKNKGYESPTPIQDQSIQLVCEGRDLVAIANTGTGKTAAFLLPIITKLAANSRERALVLLPTRELASQVRDEFESFARGLNIRALLLVGGSSMSVQLSVLRNDPQMIIGTPGRIKDLIKRNALNMSSFKTVVLDEVDRMVDIGFLPDVSFIVDKLSRPRQSLFFSATITNEVQGIISKFSENPEYISVKKGETSQMVDQNIVTYNTRHDKKEKLLVLTEDREHQKILVFVRTKRGADMLTRELLYEKLRAAAIHGNKGTGARVRALNDFKQGRVQLLVATDVAARGIDIPNVNLVINYDEPATYEDYVHRIGRTGRAGKTGKALTFVLGAGPAR